MRTLTPEGRYRRAMAVPRLVLVALLLSTSVLAGCTADQATGCTPSASSPGAEPVCFATADGWVLQGVEWHANSSEERPSVLLVHGFREHHGSYDELATRLADEGWHVLAIDLRAHGESTRYMRGPDPTLDDFGQRAVYAMWGDLNASERYMGQTPDLIVGASVGANLALAHGAANPEVDGLALLSPIPGRGPLEPLGSAERFDGALLAMASRGDRTAAGTADRIGDRHTGPQQISIYGDSAHGTQHLDNDTRRRQLVGWVLEQQAEGPLPASGQAQTGGDANASRRSAAPGIDDLGAMGLNGPSPGIHRAR